jgi:hypothetical protein
MEWHKQILLFMSRTYYVRWINTALFYPSRWLYFCKKLCASGCKDLKYCVVFSVNWCNLTRFRGRCRFKSTTLTVLRSLNRKCIQTSHHSILDLLSNHKTILQRIPIEALLVSIQPTKKTEKQLPKIIILSHLQPIQCVSDIKIRVKN